MATLVLVVLAWVGARDAIDAHRSEARARVQAELLGRAFAFEEELRREFLSLEETLHILENEWRRDPEHFDLAEWAAQVVMLKDVSLQLFIANAQGIVTASTRPAIIGTDISQRDYFRYEVEHPANDGGMFVGELVQGQVTRLWQMNLARRLQSPNNSFAGVIAASYDTNAFARFYQEIDLGQQGLISVVSMRDAEAWTLSGPSQSANVVNIAGTPLFATMAKSAEGNWIGAPGLDKVDRIYAFATVPDRGLKVVVGVDREEAMAASAAWEKNALLFTTGISLLILLLGVLLLREQNAIRLRHEVLARERAILAATLTGMSDGIMMVDADWRLVAWNHHFPEFTGVPANILRVGLPMEDILRSQVAAGEFGPVDVNAEVARRMELLRTGATMGTIERSRPSGRQLEIRRNPLPGGGFVTLYTDVTIRRQTEERLRQAQTLAALGRLTAGVAHDFNNLLAAISGNAEVLHTQLREDPVYGSRLAVILQTSGRGAHLVRQLLAFSRKQSLTPQRVDLNKIVRGMSDLLRATLGRAIRVETQLAPGLALASVDPIQIEHVILNLAINARDAMPDGGTLTIATTHRTIPPNGGSVDLQPGEYVVVSVADTGTGMSEEVLRNAFEPFFTTKPPGLGSGLGLSQVYGTATQSGGAVRIDSTMGAGTTVSVFFPRAVEGDDAEASPDSDTATQARPIEKRDRNRTILVVEDDADGRGTICDMLSANGFTAVAAKDGDEALRLIDSGLNFHLLLVDFALPDMNGVELARKVRSRRASMPVVFLTGGEPDSISGERWVLTKPFLSRTLSETLCAALGLNQDSETSQTV